jgi:hypothetical protein
MTEASGTGSGLERVNTLTTRLHRLPTIAEDMKNAYDLMTLYYLFIIYLFIYDSFVLFIYYL